jgi:hypothetical protein
VSALADAARLAEQWRNAKDYREYQFAGDAMASALDALSSAPEMTPQQLNAATEETIRLGLAAQRAAPDAEALAGLLYDATALIEQYAPASVRATNAQVAIERSARLLRAAPTVSQEAMARALKTVEWPNDPDPFEKLPEQAQKFLLDKADAVLSRLPVRATPNDTALLDWWEKHLNFEHDTDYESGEVVLYERTGNVNDREWHEVSRGPTLRAALAAQAAPARQEEKAVND